MALLSFLLQFSLAALVHATSSATNTVCKNPEQYDSTVKLGEKSCDYTVQTFNLMNPLFAKRDCDPNKGLNSKREECTGGSNCTLNGVAPLANYFRACCKDNWDFCSESLCVGVNACTCVCVCVDRMRIVDIEVEMEPCKGAQY